MRTFSPRQDEFLGSMIPFAPGHTPTILPEGRAPLAQGTFAFPAVTYPVLHRAELMKEAMFGAPRVNELAGFMDDAGGMAFRLGGAAAGFFIAPMFSVRGTPIHGAFGAIAGYLLGALISKIGGGA